MRWLCVFFPCRWVHHFNVGGWVGAAPTNHGVYQCHRCKSMSIGAPR